MKKVNIFQLTASISLLVACIINLLKSCGVNIPFVIHICVGPLLIISIIFYAITLIKINKEKNNKKDISENQEAVKAWYDDYNKLDLRNGKIKFILQDDEDMIEIRYDDGMLIDVGYIENLQSYFITVVSKDDEDGWKQPLEEIKITNKEYLFDNIQKTIYKYRK